MLSSSVKQYGINTGIALGMSAIFAQFANKFQVWKSPHGGYIASIFAERVAANPLHINAGYIQLTNED